MMTPCNAIDLDVEIGDMLHEDMLTDGEDSVEEFEDEQEDRGFVSAHSEKVRKSKENVINQNIFAVFVLFLFSVFVLFLFRRLLVPSW